MMATAWFILILLAISVVAALPVLIAMARKHPYTGLVALLSIAVGWTGFA